LRTFIEKTVSHVRFGILVTMCDDMTIPDPRIMAGSLASLLVLR
jgi:hypothetical protein